MSFPTRIGALVLRLVWRESYLGVISKLSPTWVQFESGQVDKLWLSANRAFCCYHQGIVSRRDDHLSGNRESPGFYEWLKQDLTQTCPDEQTLLEMLRDIRRDLQTQRSE